MLQAGRAVQPRRGRGASHPRPEREPPATVALQPGHMSWTGGLVTYDAIPGATVNNVAAARHEAGVGSIASAAAVRAATTSEAATPITAGLETPAPEAATRVATTAVAVATTTVGAASSTSASTVHTSAACRRATASGTTTAGGNGS